MKKTIMLLILGLFLFLALIPNAKANTIEDDLLSIYNSIQMIKNNAFLNNHPVGSIYITVASDENTAAKMATKYGGTWEIYGDNRKIKSSTGTAGITGGSNTVSLVTANLPSHSHYYTPTGSVSSKFTGNSLKSENNSVSPSISFSNATAGNKSLSGTVTMHNAQFSSTMPSYTNVHAVSGVISSGGTATSYKAPGNACSGAPSIGTINLNAVHSHTVSGTITLKNTSHTHSYTASGKIKNSAGTEGYSTFTGIAGTTATTGSGSSFSVENPYITVYMYKRTA